ncbi:molybdopterin-binding protein [Fulvimarina sp. MAC8]|uniref:molybdopterin-binding protein n=1 Tax=Fulvimarina sp. MAC8 TaxID=3162874 RepID=UPI0032ED0093
MNDVNVSRSGLSPFAETCERWLARISPVGPVETALNEALGGVIAEPARGVRALPEVDRAALDGWALASRDLVSASAYAPAMLTSPPTFLAVGDPIPRGCDCVVEGKFVSIEGPLAEVRISAAPGDGVLRVGDDVAEGTALFRTGEIVDASVVALAKAAWLTHLTIRRPSVQLIDVSDQAETGPTTTIIDSLIEKAGGRVIIGRAPREIDGLTESLKGAKADFIVSVGGTGDGQDDIAAEAIRQAGTLDAHRLAVHPGMTTALGTVGPMPVVALSGRTPDAFAVALTLVLPAIRSLSGAPEPETLSLTLTRKITSQIGFAELALLQRESSLAKPLAVGSLSLSALTEFNTWFLIPAASEGHSAGTTIDAYSFGARS